MQACRSIVSGVLGIGLMAALAIGVEAAEVGSDAPVEVTGSSTGSACSGSATVTTSDGVRRHRGESCHPTYTWSDPRLDGTVTWSQNEDEHLDVTGLDLRSEVLRIENADGAWQQRPDLSVTFPWSVGTDDGGSLLILDGEGDYRGLTALIELTGRPADPWTGHGYILRRAIPPTPARWEALARGVERLVDDGADHPTTFGPDYSAFEVDGIASVGGRILVAHHSEDTRHPGRPDAWTLETWMVGEPGTFETDMPTADGVFLPAPDGSLWFVSEGQFIAHFDGEGWTIVAEQKSQDNYVAAALDGDGRIWGVWVSGLASFKDGRWTSYESEDLGVPASCANAVAVGSDGQVVVGLDAREAEDRGDRARGDRPVDAGADGADRCGTSPLLRFDGAEWRPVSVPDALVGSGVEGLASGPSGDLWVAARQRSGSGRNEGDLVLAHLTGDDWTLRSVDARGWMAALDPRSIVVAQDGTLWATIGAGRDGVLRTDGASVERWLKGRAVRSLAAGPDGSTWAIGPDGVFVVAPGLPIKG